MERRLEPALTCAYSLDVPKLSGSYFAVIRNLEECEVISVVRRASCTLNGSHVEITLPHNVRADALVSDSHMSSCAVPFHGELVQRHAATS
jgi:hypothetical protein